MTEDVQHTKQVRLATVGVLSIVVLVVVYVIAIRTHIGQRIDAVAFDRHSAVTQATTRRTNRLLGTVSAASLLGFGGVLVLIALARRRVVLAIAAGVAMSGAVVTTEVLKKLVLIRPDLGVYGGESLNTYPSGHATIGMTLSLAAVMVAPPSLRRLALAIAAFTSTAFGTAVLSSGWHRPSDTIGGYFVTLAWFAAMSALVVPHEHALDERRSTVPDPPASPVLLGLAAIGVLGILLFVLRKSVSATGLRTVVYAAPYVLACIGIDLAGIAIVGTYYVLQRTRMRVGAPMPGPS